MEPKTPKGLGWFRLFNLVLEQHARNMKPHTFSVYVAICRYEDRKTKESFPGEEKIAELLGISRRTVSRSIKQLQRLGFIRVKKRRHKGRWLHNVYELTFPSEWHDNQETFKSRPRDSKDIPNGTGSLTIKNPSIKIKEEREFESFDLAEERRKLVEKMTLGNRYLRR